MSLEKIEQKMDLDRTDELFNSSIHRSGANDKEAYSEDDIKKMRLVVGFGNLHLNTAKVKLGALRLTGYRDNLKRLAETVKRKARNSNKYPGR